MIFLKHLLPAIRVLFRGKKVLTFLVNCRFFSQEMVMPSPLESSKKVKPLLPASTETDVLIDSYKEKSIIMKDGKW